MTSVKSPRVRQGLPVAALAGLLVAAMACSFTDRLFNRNNAEEIKGPILAVVTAASLDEQGQIVDQRYSFAPDASQVTVVVQLGELPASAPLSVIWYRVSDQGDEKLFEHTIEVETLDRAYSIGQNPGLLAIGNYKAVVTLGDQTRTVTWIVAKEQAEPEAETPQSPTAAQTQQGGRPVSGSSGKVPASQRVSAQTPAAGCKAEMGVAPLTQPKVWVIGAVSAQGSASCASLGDLEEVISINSDPPITVCGFTPNTIYGYCSDTRSICDYPGGSDLPGTVVKGILRQQSSGQVLPEDTLVLADTEAPQVQLVSDPSNGSRVTPGKTIIKLSAIAEELKNSVSWQSGVSKIEIWVTKPSGETIGTETYDAYKGKDCGGQLWKPPPTKEFKYPVPANLKDDLEICAYAYDFADPPKVGKDCVRFFTAERWQGTLDGVGDENDPCCDAEHVAYHATLQLTVDEHGSIGGQGDLEFTDGDGLSCIPGKYLLYVAGEKAKDHLALKFGPAAVNNSGCGAFLFSIDNGRTVIVPITSPGVAEGKGEVAYALYFARGSYTIRLTCQGCQGGGK